MGKKDKRQPVIDMQGKNIRQVGIVVRDAAKTAKRYSEIFGVGPWLFFDTAPTDVILHGQPLNDGESTIRIAVANLGEMQIELIQPLSGPSTHMEFLKERGEGVHHLSFGAVDNHDEFIGSLQNLGIGIEMQGNLEGSVTFSYMATQKELGTIFEALNPAPPGVQGNLKPWGTYSPPKPGLLNMEGKEIVQVGIVVKDAEKMAKRYWEVFGIGPWAFLDFKPPHVTDGFLHGINMAESDMHIRGALANLGPIQFELLEPVSGPSTHMEFLQKHGEGIHHVSFGAVDDHDKVVRVLTGQGIEIESTGRLGGAATFTYMATQQDLGTIFELVKVDPAAQNTLIPYGTYPPSQ
ncbi:MAG: VOC family protein [Deltaproteobacteria bacterium]|nr:VOC family protein [Deltaproteobacteria bacterium]